jgi:hypothetical protein
VNHPALNGFLIGDLMDMFAFEAIPTIERAFAADAVDETISGDWDEVRAGFGLAEPSPSLSRSFQLLPPTPVYYRAARRDSGTSSQILPDPVEVSSVWEIAPVPPPERGPMRVVTRKAQKGKSKRKRR